MWELRRLGLQANQRRLDFTELVQPWLRARAKAQQLLGPRFDVRDFHEILKEGAMPLTILERRVEERARARLATLASERG